MNELLREGKIRARGDSNVTLDDVRGHVVGGSISLVQNEFDPFERGTLDQMIPYCREHHILFHGRSALQAGLLDAARVNVRTILWLNAPDAPASDGSRDA